MARGVVPTVYLKLFCFVLAVGTFTVASSVFMPVQSAAAGSIRSPMRLASGGGSKLLVSDYLGQSIVIMNSDTLRVMSLIAVGGRPLGLAWASGKFFVGNETQQTVEVYSRSGKLLYILGAPGTVKQPLDIEVDTGSNQAFVVDGIENNVKVFDIGGAFLRTIGAGLLTHPTALTLDETQGRIYVSDYGDFNGSYPAKVHVLDYEGNLLLELSGNNGGFSRPQGADLDESGRLYLADAFLGQVIVIDAVTGQKLGVLGEFGPGAGQLQLPLDVLFRPETSSIFVVNNRQERIEVFQTGGVVP